MNVAIDIVSDFVCPWCFIGKARLQGALELVREKQPDVRFQSNWLPYFLNPDTPAGGEPYRAFLEAKFGGAKRVDTLQKEITAAGRDAGVEFRFDLISTRPSTLAAHRLLYRAQSIGHQPAEIEALSERLFSAHFQRGEDIGDINVLADIAAECGDKRTDLIDYFATGDGIAQVNSLVEKVTALGVSGVPFFIFQRRLAVSGAQSSAAIAAAIMQAMELPGPD